MDTNGITKADYIYAFDIKFGPPGRVKLDKDFFLAEWNSLRSEIGQRISQQTTLYQIAITAWGLILGYSLEKLDDEWFSNVLLICVYPMVAYLLSSGWAFTQTRICQIAQYLRVRERLYTEKVGLIWWENYVNDEPEVRDMDDLENLKPLHKHGKIIPAIRILVGTQLASILVAIILTSIHIAKTESLRPEVFFLIFAIVMILGGFLLSYHSYKLLKKSVGSKVTFPSTMHDIGAEFKWQVTKKKTSKLVSPPPRPPAGSYTSTG